MTFFQGNPEAIPFFIAVAVSSAVAVFVWRRRGATWIGRTFATMMAGQAGWALFEALELIIPDLATKKLCFMLRTASSVTVILCLLATVLLYTGRDWWVESRRFAFICGPAVFLVLVAWTNPLHHLFWADIRNTTINGFLIAMPEYGPGFTMLFDYCYALVALSTVLLVQAVYRSSGVYRAQATIMLFGVLLPWIVNIIDMWRVFGFIHVDTAAMCFAVTGLAFLPGLFRFRLLDLTPVAWAAVVKGMNDPVIVIDPWGRIVDLNEAAQRLIGRPSAKIIGTPAASAFARWCNLSQHLGAIVKRGEPSFELVGPPSIGPSPFDARISPLGDGDRPSGWVVVLRDISELKRAAEERLRMLRERAARAEAEAANLSKDRLLATVSHELRTPLTPVLATVTAMLADPGTAEPLRSVLEMIRRNVVLEARLIDDLLDLSRIRRGSLVLKRELIDAHELVAQVIAICRDDLESAGLKLATELAARDHYIDADPIRFQQALWNLVKNAIKFTPAGGVVTVRAHNGDGDLPASGRAELVIEVIDTGIGIEAELLPRIFDVLEQGGITSTRRMGGLGLGLTISRSILEEHGGRLSAQSAGAGHGATFTIAMPTVAPPVTSSAEEPPASAPASEDVAGSSPIRILLVDDNRETLNSLSKLLALRGYDVQTAADMASAQRAASRAEFDVLVSDIELPDGSGLELLWGLRAQRAVPAIALSGFGAAEDIEQSRSAGFAVHLTKPVDFRQLEQVIDELVKRANVESCASG
jgi:signal transduction histidine kinase/CheY-like chemotaxis protein